MTLTEIRLGLGLTLEDVAKKLNCTKGCYWNYENGKRNIPLASAIVLSKVYDITAEEVFLYSQGNQSVNLAK